MSKPLVHDIRRVSRTFLGESIATATSPLLSPSFNDIVLRTPTTPRLHQNGKQYLNPNSRLASIPQDSKDDDDARDRKLGPITPGDGGGLAVLRNSSWEENTWPLSPLTPRPISPGYTPANSITQDKLGTFSAINIIIGKTLGVGVFSVPSSIFAGVGSVGMSLSVWILGALISFCGLTVYLDLGTAIPRSGGERVYLERIFRRPYMFATCMFMAYVVLLGFSAPNCIVLGEYAVYIIGGTPNGWNARSIAVAAITLSCFIHARLPAVGVKTINILGILKMLIIVIVVALGFLSAFWQLSSGPDEHIINPGQSTDQSDVISIPESIAQQNFSGIWAGSSMQPYDYATALLKVLYCFRGYNTANQVLSEVKNPSRTLRVAAPVALALVSVSYILVNIAYFLVVDKDDFKASGAIVGAHFFGNIFGPVVGERILPLLIILSAYGNIAATSFAQSRVNQELGKDGLLPFPSLWVSRGPKTGTDKDHAPVAGLLLHWLVSVIVILVPPGEIYAFLVDIGGYPVSVISVSVAGGLLYLHRSRLEYRKSSSIHYRARTVYIVIFLVANCLLLILPWISPLGGKGDNSFPYYAYPATGLAVLASGGLYWVGWMWFVRNAGYITAQIPDAMRVYRQHKELEVEIPLMDGISYDHRDPLREEEEEEPDSSRPSQDMSSSSSY
ncbi:hypothetical protein DTO027B5_3432 [Paecilomyces variotii]|nr:hypothetical protein DTO169C6_1783 [Paecilomyces variotii]KAJ9262543.1 hypothetical protein DTO195F2_3591 [Paecilomyces variotii]KAJ9289060.1 hypothetical protein DTO021C3_3252 [Paecilomyces variotii]KAJ9324997.1 hypothetical protein DTO027B3_4129 [Paecilomyces variotii]KAJ9334926.1 hypothetical protein DTO027B5_3432 [Paecilomyces variotii]